METLTAAQAAQLLGILVEDLITLEKKGLISSTKNADGDVGYSSQELDQIKSRHGVTLADEAALVEVEIQRNLVSSVSHTRKALLLSGSLLLGYLLLVGTLTALFIVTPLQTAKWLGFIRNSPSNSVTESTVDYRVLGVATPLIPERNSPLQIILQPIGKVALGFVKNIRPDSYAQVSQIAILDPSDVLALDANGAITPGRPINLQESSLLQIGNNGLIANLNSQYIQGKQPGTNPGDLAVIGADGKIDGLPDLIVTPAPVVTGNIGVSPTPTLAQTSTGLTNDNLSGSAGITNANLANSTISFVGGSGITVSSSPVSLGGSITISSAGSSITSANISQWDNDSGYINTSSLDVFSNKTISATSNTISGLTSTNFGSMNISQWINDSSFVTASSTETLTNKSISGATNIITSIPNSSLSNPNITINTTAPLNGGSLISLGGTLSLTCPTCFTNGSSIFNAVASTGSNSTISQGGTLILAAGTNLNTTNNGAGTITFATSNTPTFSGLVTASNGLNLTTGPANLTATSGTLTLAGLSASSLSTGANNLTLTSSNFNTTATGINSTAIGASTPSTGIFTTLSSTGTTNLGSGTGVVTINSSGTTNLQVAGAGTTGNVQVGAGGVGSTTPDLFLLDVKSNSGDPTGTNGTMYYNANTNKFRCFENSAWTNCITPAGSDLQHAASYDTNEALTNIPSATQVVLGTISVTPTSATGDVYVTGFAEVRSSNATDQPFSLVIETTNNCTGSTVGNASVTYTITSAANATNHFGNIRISGIAVDAGASAHPYSLCASVSAGDTDVLNWAIEATVIDTGADLAEIYTTNDATITTGDVVSLDPTLTTGIQKSQEAYDQHMLGVISTRPGLIIGDVDKEGINAVPVALSGRVPVNVSTQNGNIAAGDPLTSSSLSGVAMKATESGPIIGTAMSSYSEEGVGQILVFVKNGVSTVTSSKPITQVLSDVFKDAVDFFGNVIFYADVTFLGHIKFNKDSAGHAFIKAGESEVSVTFEKEYAQHPIVTTSVNLTEDMKIDEVPQFAIYDLSTKGFKLKLSRTTPSDLSFSWMALTN